MKHKIYLYFFSNIKEKLTYLFSLKKFKDVQFLWIEKIFRILLNLIIWALVANELEGNLFGELSYWLALITILGPLVYLGTDQIIREKISMDTKNVDIIIFSNLFFKLTSSSIILIVFIFYLMHSKGIPYFIDNIYIVILLTTLILRSFMIFEFFFDIIGKIKLNIFLRSFSFSSSMILMLIFIFYGLNLYVVSIAFITEFIILTLLNLIVYYSFYKKRFKISLPLIFNVLKRSIPIFLCDITSVVFSRINYVLLKENVSNSEIGNLSIALRFTEVWYFAISSVMIFMFPKIIQTVKFKQKYQKNIILSFELALILAVSSIIMNIAISGFIIKFLYNAEYSDAIIYMNYYTFILIFIFLGYVQEPIEISKNILYMRVFRYGTGALVCYILNIILINKFGVLGSILAANLSYFYIFILSNFIFKEGRDILYLIFKAFKFKNTLSIFQRSK